MAFRWQWTSVCAGQGRVVRQWCCRWWCHLQRVAHERHCAGTRTSCDPRTLQSPCRLFLLCEGERERAPWVEVYLNWTVREKEKLKNRGSMHTGTQTSGQEWLSSLSEVSESFLEASENMTINLKITILCYFKKQIFRTMNGPDRRQSSQNRRQEHQVEKHKQVSERSRKFLKTLIESLEVLNWVRAF